MSADSTAAMAPVLTRRTFARIREHVRNHTGIELREHKIALCQSRLLRRLRELSLSDFDEYAELLDRPSSGEHAAMISAITTNVTAFFREVHHFEELAQRILPALVRERGRNRVRLWSAGCSTGEEPWSLAMVLDEAALPEHWDTKILATDIDTEVIDEARAGIYAEVRMAPVSLERRQRYFVRGVAARAGWWRTGPALSQRVAFRELNLFDPWPMRQPFDVIFCRNVTIYFDAARKQQLLRRFRDALAPGGYLVLGHSESVLGDLDGLEPCGRTTYRRVMT